ncbi:MAG: sigma-70 family RNA polymerase sigma factor [Firmicutes bacterium]|nr:sigma-70 family RNA polymerase sigma factor [Bacillota bacterium]
MTEVSSDEQLLAAITASDKAAMTAFYDRYERLVFSFAVRCVSDRNAAEEIVQDVFMKVWRSAESYDGAQGKLTTWLLTITKRTAIDLHRKTQRRLSPDLVEDEQLAQIRTGDDDGPEAIVQANAMRAIVKEALQTLPDDQRMTIERMYYQGYTQREIAQEMNVPLGTVKGRIRLGLSRLNEQLRAKGLRDAP